MSAEVLERRQRVITMLLSGEKDSEIAAALDLSLATVQRDIRQALSTLLTEENLRREGNS
jgi:DNA-binding NarL/FixJ family response regulator